MSRVFEAMTDVEMESFADLVQDKQGQDAEEKQPGDKLTDYSNAEKLVQRYGKIIRYNHLSKKWLIWNDKKWDIDNTGEIERIAKETVRSFYKNASSIADDDQRQALIKWAIKSESNRALEAMIELSKSETDIPVLPEQLDADPFLLNCQNGIVDLRTGELLPHKPGYLMTKITAANYIPGKKFQKFDNFLEAITCEDEELSKYLKQVIGMTAIGKVFHEGMCIFHGEGNNGKTTFLNIFTLVFNDYACTINPEVLMHQQNGRNINGAVSVEGKRFVATDELEEGKRLSSAMLKKLASTGRIIEKQLYENERSFEPSHHIIMGTNHLPKVGSTDNGTWRRIAVVPFNAKFECKGDVKNYADIVFKCDADTILSWIVEGAIQYIKNDYKLDVPQCVQAASQKYRGKEDWLQNFIDECCDTGILNEKAGFLYDTYKNWCDAILQWKHDNKEFAAELQSRGYIKQETRLGNIWNGLKVKENYREIGLKNKYRDYTQGGIADDDGLNEYTRGHM